MNPELMAAIQALMQKQQGQQGPSEMDLAGLMSPDAFSRYVGTNTLKQRAGLAKETYGAEAGGLQDQLSQAEKLQAQRFGNSGSAAGNVMGGLGDVLNSFRGGMMQQKAQGGMADALKRYREGGEARVKEENLANSDYLDALRRYRASRMTGAPETPGAAPFYISNQ